MAQSRTDRPVLVVEDHEDIRRDGRAVPRARRLPRAHRHPRSDALERIEHDPPCLILLDVMMLVIDGITFARALRRSDDRDLANAPIVLLTALQDASEALRRRPAPST